MRWASPQCDAPVKSRSIMCHHAFPATTLCMCIRLWAQAYLYTSVRQAVMVVTRSTALLPCSRSALTITACKVVNRTLPSRARLKILTEAVFGSTSTPLSIVVYDRCKCG
jgi:hypothetical protein